MSVREWEDIVSHGGARFGESAVVEEVGRAVKEYWTDLYQGSVNNEFVSERRRQVCEELIDGVDEEAAEHRIVCLAKVLDAGNRDGTWSVRLPPFKFAIPRKPGVYSPNLVQGRWMVAGPIQKSFLSSLNDIQALTHHERVLQIALSAVLWGGLLSYQRLQSLAVLDFGRLYHSGGVAWVELGGDNTADGCGPDWFPDPITWALLLRYARDYQCRSPQWPERSWWKPKDLLAGMMRLLDRAGIEIELRPSSLGELFEWVATYWRNLLPNELIGVATGKWESKGFDQVTWRRLRTDKASCRVGGDETGDDAEPSLRVKASISQSVGSNNDYDAGQAFIVELYRIASLCKNNTLPEKDAAAAVRALQEQSSLASNSIPALLGNWLLGMFEGKNRPSSQPYAPTTIYQNLSAIGRRMMVRCDGFLVSDQSVDELRLLYEGVLEDTPSIGRASVVSKVLKSFHATVDKYVGNAGFRLEDLDGFVESLTSVTAKMLTPRDYKSVIAVLQGDREDTSRLRMLCVLSVILGYRLGLRLGEVMRLQLRDFVGVRMFLRSRANRYRGNKTSNARRRLPLHIFLSEHEVELLSDWLRLRREEVNGNDSAAVFALSPDDEYPITDREILRFVHQAMVRVTGDEKMRFHVLRHSFCNWFLLNTVMAKMPGVSAVGLKGLEHPDYSPETQARLMNYIAPQLAEEEEGAGLAQFSMHELSRQMGHAWPSTTVRHYVHCLHYLLGLSLWENAPVLNAHELSALSGYGQSQTYEIMKRHALPGQERLDMRALLEPLTRKVGVGAPEDDKLAALPDLSPLAITPLEEGPRHERISLLRVLAEFGPFCSDEVLPEQYPALLEAVMKNSALPESYLKRVYDAGLSIHEFYRTQKVNPRHKPFPWVPHGIEDQTEVSRWLERLMVAESDDEVRLRDWAVAIYMHRASREKGEVLLRYKEELVRYVQFLRWLGVADGNIRLIHHPLAGQTANSKHMRWWARQVSLSVSQVITRRDYASRERYPKGRIAVQVEHTRFKRDGEIVERQGAQSFRCLMHGYDLYRRLANDGQGCCDGGASGA